MTVFLIVVATVYGLVIGSFLNAVIYRVPKKESLNTRSHCPRCEVQIRARHNIPIVSWLLLRAKCYDCGLPISWRYPAVELSGAVAFGVTTAFFLHTFDLDAIPKTLAIFGFLFLMASSIALGIIDWEVSLLPNRIVYPTIGCVISLLTLATLLSGDYGQLLRAAIGAFSLWLFYCIIWMWKPGAIGFGDVRLSLVLGFALAWLGWDVFALGVFASFMLASIFGIILILRAKAKGKTAIPFGPWMLIGAWLGVFFGTPLIDIYLHIGGLR